MKERHSEAALCGVALIGVLLYIIAKSYPPNTGGKSPTGAKVLGGKSVVNVRGEMSGGGGEVRRARQEGCHLWVELVRSKWKEIQGSIKNRNNFLRELRNSATSEIYARKPLKIYFLKTDWLFFYLTVYME